MVIIMVDDQKPKWPWQDVEVDDPTQPDDSAPAEIWQELADKFNMPPPDRHPPSEEWRADLATRQKERALTDTFRRTEALQIN
jgi:hypothetical protein